MAMSQVHTISAPVSIKSNYRTEKKKLEVIKTDSLLLPSPHFIRRIFTKKTNSIE